MNVSDNINSGEIVAVDDTPANLKLLMSILSAEGYKIRPASSGEQALSSIAKRQPELILLDINMPGIDGYEVCRRLKSDPHTCDIPVIFISALNEVSERVKGFEVGGVDFITKPFQQEEIIVRVRSHLQLRHMQMNLEELVKARTHELVSSNDRLRQSEDKFRRIVESLHDEYFFYSHDINGVFTYISPSIKGVLGYDTDEFLTNFSDYFTDNPINELVHHYTEGSVRGEQQPAYELEVYSKDRSVCILEVKESPVFDKQGNVDAVEGIAHDITLRKQIEEKLEFMAEHDPLTQLPNRVLFNYRLEQAIKSVANTKQKIAVFFLDLDQFKDVNDCFGHPFGDILLKQVANRLSESLREDSVFSRLGGDEFVLFSIFNQFEEIELLAQKIIDHMRNPFSVGGHELYLGVSIGVSNYPDDGDGVAVLIRNADSAMYQAKDQGRNTFKRYTKVLTEAAAERVAVEAELRHGLERHEFLLYYQPKVDLKSGQIIGAEALVRWLNPAQGMVPPDKFIPLAEASSLILPIGEFVLREACRQTREWLKAGYDLQHISVNISGVQIQRGELPNLVKQVLAEEGLDARYLDLEITESVLMTDPEKVTEILNSLRTIGLTLSIDDFGTGYSSLAYIKQFPINYLKIDRTFVSDITEDINDTAIASAVIALGSSLNLSVIAEGVENEAQQNFLLRLGCDYAQGYLYGRPLPADEFIALLATQSKQREV